MSTSDDVKMKGTPAKRRRRGPRGWLLVEVAVGGVMASIILGGLLINIGDADDRTTVVGRKLTAQMLAQQGIEQARAITSPQTNLANGSNVALPVPSGLRGTYTRTRTVTSGTTTVNGRTLRFKDVAVTVTFPSGGRTQTVQVQTRLYDLGDLGDLGDTRCR